MPPFCGLTSLQLDQICWSFLDCITKSLGLRAARCQETIDLHWHQACMGYIYVPGEGIPQTVIFLLGPGAVVESLCTQFWGFNGRNWVKTPPFSSLLSQQGYKYIKKSPTKIICWHDSSAQPPFTADFTLLFKDVWTNQLRPVHGSMLNRAANGHHQPQHHHPCCKPTEHTLDDHDLHVDTKACTGFSDQPAIHSIYGVCKI